MADEILTNENYFSPKNEFDYMSYSQFKDFFECEAMALAVAQGRYDKPVTDALLQGSYVDAYFSRELEAFREANPSLFKKDGTLLAKYEVCEKIIEAIKSDEGFFNEFFSGEPQRVFVGEIAGVRFKGKIDMLFPDKIVDMKCMANVQPVWSDDEHRKLPFYFYYRYDIQAAIYQELVYQATGKRLPYYLAVATKTDPVEKHAYLFTQPVLDEALALVRELAPRFDAIKKGLIEPTECGHCKYYASTHKFTMFDIEEIVKEEE